MGGMFVAWEIMCEVDRGVVGGLDTTGTDSPERGVETAPVIKEASAGGMTVWSGIAGGRGARWERLRAP